MSNIRYAADKPKQCKFCYYWGGRSKGCELGEENCYYILPEKRKPRRQVLVMVALMDESIHASATA